MDESPPSHSAALREPLPYHWALAEFLQFQYADHWAALASEQAKQEYADRVLLELNKSATPYEETSAPKLHRALRDGKTMLGMEAVEVTLWKTPEQEEFSACRAFWVLGDAHIAVKESHWQSLGGAELPSLMSALLLRWQLWHGWRGRFRTAERLLEALTHRFAATGTDEKNVAFRSANERFLGIPLRSE